MNFRKGLLCAMAASGHRVVAISPSDGHEARLAALGVEHVALPMDRQGTSPVRDMRLFVNYRSIFRRLKPDVYLGYTAKPNVYGSLAAHMLGIPVINNIAGLGTAFIGGGMLERALIVLYRLALRRSQVVFFQNSDDRALFLERGLVTTSQARLLPGSGIDLSRFDPAAKDRHHDNAPLTFLLIARLLRDKGVGEFVEAARMLLAAGAQARFQLLGAAGDSNRTAIPRAQLDAWIQEGSVEYLGHADDVRPFLAAADCIVLPSYREGLPRVLLEGGAMARPLIASNVPGCRDVVEPGVNGYLCEARSSADLARAMRQVMELAPDERARMGAAARAKVEREFDEALVIDAYLRAVDEVTKRA